MDGENGREIRIRKSRISYKCARKKWEEREKRWEKKKVMIMNKDTNSHMH